MISEAVLIERCVRLRRLEVAIEEVDAYLAERLEFHRDRKDYYSEKMRGAVEEKAEANMRREHDQEQKEEYICNLRSELESAFEFCSEDHRLLIEELRDIQTVIKHIGGVV